MVFSYITYYYLQGQRPFESITELPEELRGKLAEQIASVRLPAFRKFGWNEYVEERLKTEEWLFSEFVRQGGRPQLSRPIYFILGESIYYKERYGGMASELRLTVSEIPAERISFTIPDSMASRLIAESKTLEYDAAFHGRVFTKSGLFEFAKSYGEDKLYRLVANTEGNKIFIEAQVWDREVLCIAGSRASETK